MAAVILPHRWTRQPQGPVEIDWNNSLTLGLIHALHFSRQWDLVTRGRATLSGTVESAATPAGVGLKVSGGATINWTVPAAFSAGSFSIFALVQPAAWVTYATVLTKGHYEPAILCDANGLPNYGGQGGAAISWASSGTGVAAGSVGSYAMTRNTSIENSYDVFVNGRQCVNTGYGSAAADPTLKFGAAASGGSAFNGTYLLALLYSAGLPDERVAELHRNPWQLFRPLSRRTYFFPAGGGAWTLAIDDASHGNAVDNVALSQTNALAVADALHGHSVDAPVLTQAHVLAVLDALHAHAADNVDLSQASALTVAEATHSHGVDNVVLVQAHVLAVADALHAHAAEALTLTQANTLTTQDALHAHAADNVTVSAGDTLAVAETVHAHSADNLTLTQANVLVVQETAHGHTVDNVTLSFGVALAIADALHAHAVDTVALTQAHVLAVQGAVHGHLAEAVALTQASVLIVSDTLHAQIADAITLRMPGVIGASTLFVVAAAERVLVVAHSQRYFTVH